MAGVKKSGGKGGNGGKDGSTGTPSKGGKPGKSGTPSKGGKPRKTGTPRKTRVITKGTKGRTKGTKDNGKTVKTAKRTKDNGKAVKPATRTRDNRTTAKAAKRTTPRPAPQRTILRIRELDPYQKCGPGTSVERLIRVDEQLNGRKEAHLVYFDRHGWYCEHGRTCHAVKHARKA